MKKTLKKGFTIVELVIVIAVVAILAAVLIPTFVSVTKKANESKDTQLVRNLNTALAVDTEVGKHTTMQSALEAAEKAGYDVAKINTSSTDNEILWDSVNDCFVYKKGDSIEYIPNSVTEAQKSSVKPYQYWVISGAPSEEYSTYLYNSTTDTFTVKTGLDVGNETVTSVNYVGNTASQTVTIRTNSFDTVLTVNAENDTVKHYGEAKEINVVKVAMSSYHEFGDVLGNVYVANGNVEIEENASVSNLIIKELKYIDADGKEQTVMPTASAVKATVSSKAEVAMVRSEIESVSVSVVANVPDTVAKIEANDSSVAYVGKIGYTDLKNALTSAVNGQTVVLLQNVNWENGNSVACVINKSITLDLNNHAIAINNQGIRINQDNSGSQINVTLKNGTINRTNSTGSTCCVYIYSGAKVVCEGLTVNQENTAAEEYYAVGIVDNNAELIINSGVYNGLIGTLGSCNGNLVTLNGGEFNQGCYFPARGNYTINGGTFRSINKFVFYVKSGTPLNINGGTYNVTINSNYKNEWAHHDNGAKGGNAVFVFEACSYGNSGVNPSASISSNVKINITKEGYTDAFYDVLVINYGYMDSNKKYTDKASGNTANTVNTDGIEIPYRVANEQITGHVTNNNLEKPSDGWYVFNDSNTTLHNPKK